LIRLTVDLGNSFCKLRAWQAPASPVRGAEPEELIRMEDLGSHAEALSTELERWTRGVEGVERAAICSVASVGRTARVAEGLIRAVGTHVEVDVDPPSGLENRCRTPETVGADRLFAARGAMALVGRSCLVVDAGTAVTVDVVLDPRGAQNAGAFLGGAIAPGPELLARSLAEGTWNLPRIEPAVGAPALGRDTAGALRSGVGVGFRGAVRELARRIAAEAGLGEVPIVLTGGAREHLLEPEPVFEGEVVVHGHLVHLGLLAVMQ